MDKVSFESKHKIRQEKKLFISTLLDALDIMVI